MQVTPSELQEQLRHILRAGLVPMITGSPGIGKSDIAGREICKEYKLDMIDKRLSQSDQTDLLGFPDKQDGRMGYAPPEDFPLQSMDKPSTNKNGWLLFLDEFSSASLAVQAAAYKLVLDRQVGKHDLHNQCYIICAGNKATDRAIVNRLNTAMQSRLVHLELVVHAEDWLKWAAKNNVDYRITSYIEHRPDLLHKFDPDHNDDTFSCPRTWHFASKLVKNQTNLRNLLPSLAGSLSEGVAREFVTYSELCTSLPSIKEILAKPASIDIDQDPAMLYAMSHMVAAYLEDSNIDKLVPYINRLPMEFGVVTMRSALKRNQELIKTDAGRKWADELAKELF